MGDKARARSAMRQAVKSLGYRDDQDWYQSPLRDVATLTALAVESGQGDIARQLQGRLENVVKDPDALNTQEQAAVLHAAYATAEGGGSDLDRRQGRHGPAAGRRRAALGGGQAGRRPLHQQRQGRVVADGQRARHAGRRAGGGGQRPVGVQALLSMNGGAIDPARSARATG
jgi:uncharacterized protein YfaS (alpha-2-macroglobulin family)